jgi:hypothetical protein
LQQKLHPQRLLSGPQSGVHWPLEQVWPQPQVCGQDALPQTPLSQTWPVGQVPSIKQTPPQASAAPHGRLAQSR